MIGVLLGHWFGIVGGFVALLAPWVLVIVTAKKDP